MAKIHRHESITSFHRKCSRVHGVAFIQAACMLLIGSSIFPSIDLRSNSLTAAALVNQLSLLTKYKNCITAIQCVNKAETIYWLNGMHLLRNQRLKDGVNIFLQPSQREHKTFIPRSHRRCHKGQRSRDFCLKIIRGKSPPHNSFACIDNNNFQCAKISYKPG